MTVLSQRVRQALINENKDLAQKNGRYVMGITGDDTEGTARLGNFIKKSHRCNGQPLRAYRRHPYWAAAGWLGGGLKALVVRDGAKYDATNRLTLPAAAAPPQCQTERPPWGTLSLQKARAVQASLSP